MKSETKFEIIICPKCKSYVLDEHGKCNNCINNLSLANRPSESTHAEYLQKAEKSKFTWFAIKAALVLLLISVMSLIVGLVLVNNIPGCSCDESLRCSDCASVDDFLSFLITGGFFGVIFSFIFILPMSLVIAFFASLRKGKK